jgi:hypothetical protein
MENKENLACLIKGHEEIAGTSNNVTSRCKYCGREIECRAIHGGGDKDCIWQLYGE